MITRTVASVTYGGTSHPQLHPKGMLDPETRQPFAYDIDPTNRERVRKQLTARAGVTHADVGNTTTIITYRTSLGRQELEEHLERVFAQWAVEEGFFPEELRGKMFYKIKYLDDLVP